MNFNEKVCAVVVVCLAALMVTDLSLRLRAWATFEHVPAVLKSVQNGQRPTWKPGKVKPDIFAESVEGEIATVGKPVRDAGVLMMFSTSKAAAEYETRVVASQSVLRHPRTGELYARELFNTHIFLMHAFFVSVVVGCVCSWRFVSRSVRKRVEPVILVTTLSSVVFLLWDRPWLVNAPVTWAVYAIMIACVVLAYPRVFLNRRMI